MVNANEHVFIPNEHMVNANEHVFVFKSDMARTRENVVLPLKPHFFKTDGQKAPVGAVEVNRQDAMTPRCQRNLASATALPVRRILKGFNHPAQGCAARATLGIRKPFHLP